MEWSGDGDGWESLLVAGVPIFVAVAAVSALLSAYELDQRRRGLAEATIRRRAGDLRTFNRWLAPGRLLDATEEQIQTFLDGRQLAARTRYCWVSNLHSFYAWAVRTERIDRDPTRNIVRPKLPRNLPRPICEDDLRLALEMASPTMRAWLLLGSFAGLRCAEIARLERGDVVDGERLLRVRGKGNKERLVPLHDDVWTALRAVGLPRTGPLFRRPQGAPYPPAMVSREVAVFFDGLGIEATAHQLRHYFGTRIYAVSKDLRVTQELLGHASPTTTAIYTAFSRQDAAAAVAALHLVDDRRDSVM